MGNNVNSIGSGANPFGYLSAGKYKTERIKNPEKNEYTPSGNISGIDSGLFAERTQRTSSANPLENLSVVDRIAKINHEISPVMKDENHARFIDCQA